MRCPGCCSVHHLPTRSPRAAPPAGFPWRPRRSALHRAGTQGGPRPQVPQPPPGGAPPCRLGGQRHRGHRRSTPRRHRHVGANQRRPETISGIRPGRIGRSTRRPPTRCSVPPAARQVGCVGHSDRAVAGGTAPGAGIPRPTRPRRPPGDRHRRRRHHRSHPPGSRSRIATCRRGRAAPVCGCLDAGWRGHRRPSLGPCSGQSHPGGLTRLVASHR